jgi:hypothetical protein
MKLKPLYMCPECSNHMYSNNMVSRYNISVILQDKILQNDPCVRKKITERCKNLSVGGASTGTAGGEAGQASFFFILPVPLILTPIFDSIESNDRGKFE